VEARGSGKGTETGPYRCWTIRQPHWRPLPPPLPEDLDHRGPRFGWIAVIVTGTFLAVAGLRWIVPWYVAAIGGVIVAAALLLALDKFDEVRRRRYWRNWPERYEFVPGSARPSENRLRGYVIEPPVKDDTIEAWQRFLAETRDLPQHYAVVRSAVRKAEAELAHRINPAR
jgi:hypothetical protein